MSELDRRTGAAGELAMVDGMGKGVGGGVSSSDPTLALFPSERYTTASRHYALQHSFLVLLHQQPETTEASVGLSTVKRRMLIIARASSKRKPKNVAPSLHLPCQSPSPNQTDPKGNVATPTPLYHPLHHPLHLNTTRRKKRL